MKKKVVIIGGGIAGLSAGVYALRCGFDATVLESHSIAGGNCTSWKRGGYLFEGGMHWLTGSNPKEPINKLWRTVGALDDSVRISNYEPYVQYDYQGTPIKFYRDVDETQRHLTGLAPQDAKEIKKMCDSIRSVRDLAMPISDIKGVKATKPMRPPISLAFSAMSAMRVMIGYAKVNRGEYLARFKHPGLREAISTMTTVDNGVLPFFFSMGIFARGDGGFPEGGSLPFVQRIVDRFTSMGGELRLKTRAERVLLENRRAVGVRVSGETLPADAVIVACDTMQIDHLFDEPLKAAWLDEMRAVTGPTMTTFLSLGIDADLRRLPHSFSFKPEKPLTLADQTYEFLSVNNYSGDPAYSPEGKSALTLFFGGDTYDFWKRAKENGTYAQEKRRLADAAIEALAQYAPETRGKAEVADVATPLTYERYCNTWKGSWMTEMTPSMKMKDYPAAIEGLSGLYFAGQRMQPPGGLPVALMTGRTAVQYLCRDTDVMFISEE